MKNKMVSFLGEFPKEMCSPACAEFEFDFCTVVTLTLIFPVNVVTQLVTKFVRYKSRTWVAN